jgi:electron transfer flavoprotein beta subunit
VLNPSDACAVEAAVRLKQLLCRGDPRGRPASGHPENSNSHDKTVINNTQGSSDCTIKVITLGPEDAKGALRAALALGADSAVRLWNASAGEWGPFAVAAALAGYLKTEAILPDLVLCGDSSSDWSSGIVGPALAEQLALPQVTGVIQLSLRMRDEILRFTQNDKTKPVDDAGLTTNDIALSNSHEVRDGSNEVTFQLTRRLEHGYRELLEAELPLLITVMSDLNESHYPSLPAHMAALKAEIPVIDPQPMMDDYWLDETDEMALLEMYAPRPLPRHIPAPDSRHSAYQRIGEIVAGGAIGRKTHLVQGTSEQLAKALVDFLKNRGFV